MFDPGPIDNVPGPKTVDAIKRFQKAKGLTVDGKLGPITLSELTSAIDAIDTGRLRVSPEGRKLIQAYEGIEDGDPTTPELEPYICPAGVVTIGRGHALLQNDGRQIRVSAYGARDALAIARTILVHRYGRPYVTYEEAEQLFEFDVIAFSEEVYDIVGNTSQSMFDALCSFAFNVGTGGLRGSSLLRYHLSGAQAGSADWRSLRQHSRSGAAPRNIAEGFCAWSRASGVWMLGLFRRRYAEYLVYCGLSVERAIQIASTLK